MLFTKKTPLILLGFCILTLLSCESNFRDIQKIHHKAPFYPAGIAENMQGQFVDSGRVKAILVSNKMLDYSTVKYKFTEFPEGIHLTFFDNDNNKNTVVADYAIQYTTTELVDLRGNVVITTHDNKKLESDQLYYDQKRDWFYTNGKYKASTDKENFTQGVGVDFDGKLNVIKARNSYAESIKKEN
ncbi:LPS export ABC transporter periplasmic protein LptC [Myroides sp. C15-4]|uniref:LPS export ABC transporter periplasmic protein LptC n=1 Tax=Myroides sp. C15-4 TaxID=3400532 RepID=UPI003D2F7927